MTSIRLPTSFALSLLATVTMFWFLGLLIAGDPSPRVPIPTIRVDFTPHIPDTPEVPKTRIRPPIEKPKPPPEKPTVTIDPKKATPFDERDPGLKPNTNFPGEGPGGPTQQSRVEFLPRTGTASRAPVPQVRIEPDYPGPARTRGIEGSITFRFTVAVDGSVKDIEILESDPPKVWDSATIRAVSSWRYQPAIRDGKPVEQRGMVATYRYELER
jgi:periplasmic protein TonB